MPLLKFAPSLGLVGVAVPSSAGQSLKCPGRLSTVLRGYRQQQGKRENISTEINPPGESGEGTGLIGKTSGRHSVGSVRIAFDVVDEMRVLRSEISDRVETAADGARKAELQVV